MIITLSPMRSDSRLDLYCDGDALVFNGISHNLSTFKEGICDWILGQPERIEGIWHVDVILPHGPDAPKAVLFPKPVRVKGKGPVALPTAPNTPEPDV